MGRIEALNGCEYADQCGLMAYFRDLGKSGVIDCGRPKPTGCARHPESKGGWVGHTNTQLTSHEDLEAAFPNGLEDYI